MELLSPITPIGISFNGNNGNGFSNTNLDYLSDENRFTIGAKFHQTLPTTSTIPPFTPNRVNEWKDRMKSWLRSCHALDYLIRDDREATPVRVDAETEEQFDRRMVIYKARDRALYLVLDKSLSSAAGTIDPKFLALSEQLSLEDSIGIGGKLYDGVLFLIKGSHLWSRVDTLTAMVDLKLDRVGLEQAVFNTWKREADVQVGLQLDLAKVQKLLLIKALNHRREHKAVMLQLAALNPDELFALTPQQILERFIASAGHIGGSSKEAGESVALLAEHSGKRKWDTSTATCFKCKKIGHVKSECPLRSGGNKKKIFNKKNASNK